MRLCLSNKQSPNLNDLEEQRYTSHYVSCFHMSTGRSIHTCSEKCVNVSLFPTSTFLVDEAGNRNLRNHSLAFQVLMGPPKAVDDI